MPRATAQDAQSTLIPFESKPRREAAAEARHMLLTDVYLQEGDVPATQTPGPSASSGQAFFVPWMLIQTFREPVRGAHSASRLVSHG